MLALFEAGWLFRAACSSFRAPNNVWSDIQISTDGRYLAHFIEVTAAFLEPL
jgi:hypothetical protein